MPDYNTELHQSRIYYLQGFVQPLAVGAVSSRHPS